ncbi:MAG: HDOD domain-containing protein [Candidatus Zixiibacteriota bacterium]
MNRKIILEQISRNDKILSLPQVLAQVLEAVSNEDLSPDALARIILRDTALTGRLLRLANSPYYRRFAGIKTVHQAVSLLGVTTVKCLALSSSVFHPEKISKESGINAKSYFTYALSVASASEKIATTLEMHSTEEAAIAGLLHDIGILFFLHHYPREYRRIVEKKVQAKTLLDAEIEVFGINHCEIGSELAKSWKLPSYIAETIADHHSTDVTSKNDRLGNIVRLAVHMATDQFSGYAPGLEHRLANIKEGANALGLTQDQLDAISTKMLASTVELSKYLGVDIGEIEDMLMGANEEIWKSYLLIENLFKERQELSQNLLEEERARGAVQQKNVAMATLSHYLNNAVMAISGRSQLMRLYLDKGNTEKLLGGMTGALQTIDNATKRIVAVLEEMKDISPIDRVDFYNMSEAMNIDERIERRLEIMHTESGLVVPDDIPS